MNEAVLKKLYIALGVLISALIVSAIILAVSFSNGRSEEQPSNTDNGSTIQTEEKTDDSTSSSISQETEAPLPEYQDITLSFVGDCMLASESGQTSSLYFNRFAETADQSYFFEKVAEYFATDDFTIANCENVFTDKKLQKIGKSYTPAYWYKSPSVNAEIFKKGSVDILSVANNHTYDYGEEGAIDTKAALESAGLVWGGDDEPIILEKDGIKIWLYLCTMYSEWQAKTICNMIAEAQESTDYQIVYYHGGTEHQFVPDEWRVRASRKMVDAGADLVIGAHPHVLQPIEEYNGAVIIYSLGNFLFGGARQTTDPYKTNRTIIYQQVIRVKDGEIIHTEYKMIPCYQYKNVSLLWQPIPIDQNEDSLNYEAVIDFMLGKRESPVA